ncbi:MAG: nucleotide-binding universal stress UspA family protein [Crocinitomicaceae bacterium]|jgi:nucleotide-binding universal stress UspA family protein
MRVIITTDLAEDAASNILPLLSMFTKSDGLEIVLFHCIEPPSSGSIAIITINDILWKNAQDRMTELVAELNEQSGNKYTIQTEVRLGQLVGEVSIYLKNNTADLLVLETAKRKGFRKLTDPQRALEFIGGIPISTLIVPTDYRTIKFAKIGVALDTTEDISALNTASFDHIKAYFGAQLKPFHVTNISEERTNYSLNGAFGNEIISIVQNDNIEVGIKAWCDQEKIDVLCMLTHHKNIFSKTFSHSVIRMMIKSGDLPVLVLTAQP